MKPLSKRELKQGLVFRKPDDHKGTFGHLLILAGSTGMAGAALLTCRAALRSGAGLVTLGVPSCLQACVAQMVPEALTLGLPDTSSGCFRPEAVAVLKNALIEKGFSALAIGPGISTHPETARFVVHVLGSVQLPTVVDADALNNLTLQEPGSVRQLLERRAGGMVFTPHPGEMARCLQTDVHDVLRDREAAARKLARDWKGVVVLKGHRSIITDGDRVVCNATGGPGLAKGGSGDLLTGMIGGLWTQMLASGRVRGGEAFKAAALGCHLHGLAGDLAEKEGSPWTTTSSDVLAKLPQAFKKL